MSYRKVIIFDSGVGGLSIWQEVQQLLASVECHYLFDNAYFPYGELAESILIQRVCQLLPALVAKTQAEAVVIACNTASTAALQPLRERLSIPVIGVVPAIKPAALLSQSKHIAVVATPATVKRRYTQQLIADFAPDCEVTLMGSSALVHMAEQFLMTEHIEPEQLKQELAPLVAKPDIDALVLGCTHFPLLKKAMAEVLPNKVQLIDSGQAIAKQLQRVLPKQGREPRVMKHCYYYTKEDEAIDGLAEVFERFGFNLGQILQPTQD